MYEYSTPKKNPQLSTTYKRSERTKDYRRDWLVSALPHAFADGLSHQTPSGGGYSDRGTGMFAGD
jgi:hypothetical protein